MINQYDQQYDQQYEHQYYKYVFSCGEKHCPPPNHLVIGPQHRFHCKTVTIKINLYSCSLVLCCHKRNCGLMQKLHVQTIKYTGIRKFITEEVSGSLVVKDEWNIEAAELALLASNLKS